MDSFVVLGDHEIPVTGNALTKNIAWNVIFHIIVQRQPIIGDLLAAIRPINDVHLTLDQWVMGSRGAGGH